VAANRTVALATLALANLALALGGCGGGETAGRGDRAPAAPFDGAAFPAGVGAPGFALEDQSGRAVSLSAQRGHVVLLAFLGADCRACSLAAQQIRGALDEVGTEGRPRTLLVDYGATPASPARRAAFLAAASLSGRASFLGGSPAQLRQTWRAYSLPRPPQEDAIALVLVDRHGYERVAFGLEQLTPEALSHDIRLLIT